MGILDPKERLIVAIDENSTHMIRYLHTVADVNWFKLNATYLMTKPLVDIPIKIMLDLKAYDTPDTIKSILELASKIMGRCFITVHEKCVPTKVPPGVKVLAVGPLTSDGPSSGRLLNGVTSCGGLVCHPSSAGYYRRMYGPDITIVCPGIRLEGDKPDDHVYPVSPGQAIRSGADFIVVGRPITRAADPLAVVKAIFKEIADAS